MVLFDLVARTTILYVLITPLVYSSTDLSCCPLDTGKLRVYCRNLEDYAEIPLVDPTNLDDIRPECCNPNQKTIIFCHGLMAKPSKPNMAKVLSALVTAKNTTGINVIFVDWTYLSFFYKSCMQETARAVADILVKAIQAKKLKAEQLNCHGHSLGAHLCAIISQDLYKTTGKKIDGICGLDPANPFFDLHCNKNQSISEQSIHQVGKGDAEKSVLIIHTNSGFLGTQLNCGTCNMILNFYGAIQPNQGMIESHSQALIFYADMIRNGGYVCRECDSYESFEKKTCSNSSTYEWILFPTTMCNSKCYIKTKDTVPYGLGMNGTNP